jgi:uncharacterized protein YggE
MSRQLMVLGIIVSALLLAGCSVTTASPDQPCAVNCYGATPAAQRTLSVTGEGKVNVTPDIAVAYLSVVSRDPRLATAWDDNNAKPTGEITYVVAHTLTVTVRDLAKVGAILGDAQAAGVNSVGGVSFTLEDSTAAISQARALAMANAKARAEELAAGLGVKVGKVITISEYGVSVPYPAADKAYAMGIGGGGSSVPISAGTWVVSMSVGVVFEIE